MTETTTAASDVQIRRLPWSNLSTTPDGEYATAEQMLTASGLNWGVELTPLYRYEDEITNDGVTRELKEAGIFDIRRTDSSAVLGQVKERYTPYDNVSIFNFADAIVDDGKAKFTAAGEQAGGKKVFLVLKLHEGVKVLGEDPHDLYLFIRTGHDGGTAVSPMVIPFRLECSNATPLALRTAKVRWSFSHVGELDGKLQKARESLKLTYDYVDEFSAFMEKLAGVKMTDAKVTNVINDVVAKDRSNRENTVQGILDTYANSTTNGYQGTGLGVIQALTEYYDHIHPRRTDSVRLESVVNGEAYATSNKAAQLILARASK